MANAYSTNFPIGGTGTTVNCMWRLTRVMKAAGWTYKCSSNGNQKDISGNPANDLWGTNTSPLNDNYSVINTITTGSQSLPTATLNVSSTANFPPAGTISVATSTNGWQNVTYTGTTASSFTGASGGTGTVPASSEVAQGASTVTFEQSVSWWVASGPQTIKFALNANPTGTPVRSEIVTQASTTAAAELIGFVWDSVGSTGWAVLGPQSPPAATTVNGTVTFPSATLNVVSTTGFATSGWIQVQTTTGTAIVYYTGVSGGNQFTGCTTFSTGTATSGNGVTGSSVQFNGTNSLTGSISGATLVPLSTTVTTGSNTINVNTFTGAGTLNAASTIGFPTVGTLFVSTGSGTAQITYTGTTAATFTGCTTSIVSSSPTTPFSGVLSTGGAIAAAPVYYNREFMFGRPSGSGVQGTTYYICSDPQIEYAPMYSTLATSSGCTALIWPGGGGTNNGFNIPSPVTAQAINICTRGIGGGTTSSDGFFAGSSNSIYGASAQLACVNNIPSAGTTADGSFYGALYITTANFMTGWMFTRLDDSEPGDVDPYVIFGPGNSTFTFGTYSRTSAIQGAPNNQVFMVSNNIFQGSYPQIWGYQARGNTVTSRDVTYAFQSSATYSFISSELFWDQSTTNIRLIAHPAAVTPLVKEPVIVTTVNQVNNSFKQFKGRMRWAQLFSQGNTLDTFDNKAWLCVMALIINNCPAMAWGPYDGATTPSA